MKKFTSYFGEKSAEFEFEIPKINKELIIAFLTKNYSNTFIYNDVIELFKDFIELNNLQLVFLEYFEDQLY